VANKFPDGFSDESSDDDDQVRAMKIWKDSRDSEETETDITPPPTYSESTVKAERSSAPHVAQAKTLSILLSVLTGDDGVILKSIDELPSDLRSDLQKRFEDMCTATKNRRLRYGRIEKGPKFYATKNCCVRDAINRSTSDFSNGITFGATGRVSADVRCTKAREPCAYVVMHEDVPSLCMVPLPEEKRVGKTWTELGYWVQV
jgi:hypothetical protein